MFVANIKTKIPTAVSKLPAFDEDIVYTQDPEKREKLGITIPSSLKEAIKLNPWTEDVFEIDENIGLTYYYP
jgi:hypothetical protein